MTRRIDKILKVDNRFLPGTCSLLLFKETINSLCLFHIRHFLVYEAKVILQ